MVAVDVLELLPAALGALEVEARSVFSKLHDGSVLSVDVHRGLYRRVHGYATSLSDGGHGQNVG